MGFFRSPLIQIRARLLKRHLSFSILDDLEVVGEAVDERRRNLGVARLAFMGGKTLEQAGRRFVRLNDHGHGSD